MAIVTVTLAKQFLRIEHKAQDDVLAIMLDAASEWITKETGIAFCDTAYTMFTEPVNGGGHSLWVAHMPIRAVVSIEDADAEVGMALDETRFDSNRIWLESGERWADGGGRWKVIYTAGYKAAEVPADLRLLALQIISRAYNQRKGVASDSAGGYSESFEPLLTSGEMIRLRQYRMGGVLG